MLSMFLYFDPKSTLFVVVVEFVSAFRDSTDLGLLYQLSFKVTYECGSKQLPTTCIMTRDVVSLIVVLIRMRWKGSLKYQGTSDPR